MSAITIGVIAIFILSFFWVVLLVVYFHFLQTDNQTLKSEVSRLERELQDCKDKQE